MRKNESRAYFNMWNDIQGERGVNLEKVKEKLKAFTVETPSWGYGASGTRFKVFHQPGTARSVFERLDDAAIVNKLTGACPSVALHIPWDRVPSYKEVKDYAASIGLLIGAINPNVFQEEIYRYGSIAAANPVTRETAIDHLIECIEIGTETESNTLSLWFADGTNYPGQASFRERKHQIHESLERVYRHLPPNMRMLIEYKFFEPAMYHTDFADWGMAYTFANRLGSRAEVLVDLGHHSQGTNVEHIVAFLLDEGKLGGFHFNNRKYADDDLIVGSIQPYELFLIFHELVSAELDAATSQAASRIAYMIDQCHNIEAKIPAMIRSVMNIQTAYAKALLVDRDKLYEAQSNEDVLAAEAELREAYEIDVSPLLAQVREEQGLHPDPMRAYVESAYQSKIEQVRG